MNRLAYTLFLGLMLCTISQIFGQVQPEFRLVVKDANGYLPDVTVELRSAQNTYTGKTGIYGSYAIVPIASGTYTISAKATGYATYEDTVHIAETQHVMREVLLFREATDISEISVVGKTETQQVREQAVRAVVVDTRAVAEQPATLAELMNRAPGIRIRQSGGLGSQADISMNGFQGRAIRYFKDGIPLDYLGSGYGVHNIPVNALERVEVYRGVLPIELGADALGGAVNLVTRQQHGDHLHASYEIASFHTHRLSLNGRKQLSSGFYTGAETFFNYSDNNYRVDIVAPDPNTLQPAEHNVELFHNGYKGFYGEGYVGVQNKLWAKDLRLTFHYYEHEREQQHPALMTNAYGAIVGRQSSFIPTIQYKLNLFEDDLQFEQFLVHNTIKFGMTDTLQGRYDWFGNFTPRSNGQLGEGVRPTLSDIDIQQTTSRSFVSYMLSPNHNVALNYVYSRSRRQGNDPLGPRFQGTDIDVLSIPAMYEKQVLGINYTTTIIPRTEISVMGKYLSYRSEGTESWGNRPISIDEVSRVSNSYEGIGAAIKYQIHTDAFVRGSAEYAYRLPEMEELFGDAIWVVPNFAIRPEKSLNTNLGINLDRDKLHLETNTFYRRTRDLIIAIPTIAPYAQFQNINNVEGFGVELDVHYQVHPSTKLLANGTWQSLRLFGFEQPADQWRNGTRLQNTPYFFTNLGFQSTFNSEWISSIKFTGYGNYNFVREFYLQTIPKELESKGFLGLGRSDKVNSDVVIPSQHLLNIGLLASPSQGKYTLGFECKNLMDNRLYDYFRVQRAGRSFHFKVIYTI